jgi:hypothetical protein
MADIRVSTQVVISALTSTADIGQSAAHTVISPAVRTITTGTGTYPTADGHGVRIQDIADSALPLPGAPTYIKIHFLWIRASVAVDIDYTEGAGATARVVRAKEFLLDCSNGDYYVQAVTVTALANDTEVKFYFAGEAVTPA